MLNKLIRTSNDPALLFLRLILGIVFFAHGAQKVLGWFGGGGFQATMQSFTQMGMPAPVAFLVILGEFLGSLGLIAGCLSRIAASGVLIIMLGAIFMVHRQYGFFMNWFGQQQGEGIEYHLLAIAVALAIVMRGGGMLSIDGALSQKLPPRSAARPR